MAMNKRSPLIASLLSIAPLFASQYIELSIQKVARKGAAMDVFLLVKNNLRDSCSVNLKEIKISSFNSMAVGTWSQALNKGSKQAFGVCFRRGDWLHFVAPGAAKVMKFRVPFQGGGSADSLKVDVSVADFFIGDTLRCSTNEVAGKRMNPVIQDNLPATIAFRKAKVVGQVIDPGVWRFRSVSVDSLMN